MKKLILLHGMSARLDDCFGLSVKEWAGEFGFEIIEPIFPLEKDITIESWTKIMDQYISKIDEETSFVCHSLGCTFVVKYLAEKMLKANTVIAVAGGYFTEEQVWSAFPKIKKFVPSDEDFEYFRNNTKKVYHIHSDNDNIFNDKFFSAYIKRTNAEETIIPNAGHFGRSSGVKEVKKIKEILKSINSY